MEKSELYDLLRNYESPSAIELNRALDAIKQLVEDKEISEELAKNLIKLLISKHIHHEMAKELYSDKFGTRPTNLKFLNFRYGRRHETYA